MPHSPHPSLRVREGLRRAWRVAVPVLVTGSLVASGIVIVSSTAATAAGGGSIPISADPVDLTQATDPGIGRLTPTPDAAENGMFGPQVDWPIVPIHAVLARTGHLITFGTPRGAADQSGLVYDDWDPAAGTADSAHLGTATMHSYDSFCNSLVTLADGRMLMVGGNSAMSTMLYDPVDQAQAMGYDLNQQRWYATTLRLVDGRVLVIGGGNSYKLPAPSSSAESDRVAITPEIGSGSGAWTSLTGATSSALFGLADSHWWYPRAFNGIGGTVLGISGDQIWRLDPDGSGAVQAVGTLPFDPRTSGSQVMYSPGKILVAGGGQYSNGDDTTGTNSAAIVEFAAAGVSIRETAPMTAGRNWANLTVLPTGEVLANGGTHVGTEAGDANSVRQAEVWNPSSETWRTAASAQRTRTYHSTSVLLPSGAVFTGGGGVPGPETNFNAEIYYPSYLFSRGADGSVTWASRPAITSITGSATWGGSIAMTMGDDRPIARASLISLPSVTHSQNTDQRRVPLQIVQDASVTRTSFPSSTDTMPPGDYELTVIDAKGVPSSAQIVTLRTGAPGLVTPSAASIAPSSTPTNATTSTGGPVAAAPAPAVNTGSSTAPSSTTATSASPAPAPAPPQTSPSPAAPPSAPGSHTSQPATRVSLVNGTSIGLAATIKSGTRVAHSKAVVSVRKAGAHSAKSLKRATSWVVKTGLGSKLGYSFESVDKPGYFLVTPRTGSGRVVLAKRTKTASFASRATFDAVTGAAGRGVSFRVSANTTRYLRVDGTRLLAGPIGESPDMQSYATFTVPKGLARKP